MPAPLALAKSTARAIWIGAQRLDVPAPFGQGPEAVRAAVEHLGYVQIDTINVVERCHHHILFTRIPGYRRADLHQAQSVDKSLFEYWTHALAYVPARDLPYFLPAMARHRREPIRWFADVPAAEVRKVVARVRKEGALSIRDIDDDVLVEKDHPWSSRKPSKFALQRAFHDGFLTVSARTGMLKTYELTERHFSWEAKPKPAPERDVLAYMLDRALRSQGLVSLDSICHLDAPRKGTVRGLIEARVRRGTLVPVAMEGARKVEHWAQPGALDAIPEVSGEAVHVLSPFDPLVIQRKRLKLFFDYDHLFEAYVPKQKRKLGYFALPVLVGDRIVAAIDLKTDRAAGKLLIQKWTNVDGGKRHKARIEQELHRFERFQLGE